MVTPEFHAPRLALGTVQWGQRYGIANRTGRPGLEEVRAMLDAARRAGVTFLDTARAYGDSERVIGELVGDDPAWAVVTKLSPGVWEPGQSARRAVEATLASLDASRQALRRPTLHTVLLHRPIHRIAAGGAIWDALRRDRDAGRVGALGVSAEGPDDAFDALDDPDVAMIQVAASLLDQRLARAGFFDRAAGTGRTVVVRSLFLQGVGHLAPGELPAFLGPLRSCLERIHAWSASRGMKPARAFLLYARFLHPAIVLLGCESLGQLRENLEAWQDEPGKLRPLRELADSIPDLPEAVLNPARWEAA